VIDLAVIFNVMQNNDCIMPINFTMGTCLALFKVGSGGLIYGLRQIFYDEAHHISNIFLVPLAHRNMMLGNTTLF
jgi:hypothetical protein